MAVSFRIVMFLVALVVFGALYGLVGEVVALIEPMVVDHASTSDGSQLYQWVAQLWALAPVMAFIAAAAWLLKQSVVVQR